MDEEIISKLLEFHSFFDKNLEEKVVYVLNEISVDFSPKDIEACHCLGVSKNGSKKTIVCFINRKHTKKALFSRKKLIVTFSLMKI